VRDVARALAEADEAPHVIISSPLVRALQTAEIVASIVKLDAVETAGDMAPGGDGAALVKRLVEGKRKRAMIVGHEPDLSELVHHLTNCQVEMGKAMVVGIAARGDEMTLRFILHPKTLAWERFA
jgi:phosphohistidine phosphatase